MFGTDDCHKNCHRLEAQGQTKDMTGIKRDVTCRALSIPVMSSSLSFAEEETLL